MTGMHLRAVTTGNYEAALALTVRPDQEDLVEPVVNGVAAQFDHQRLAGEAADVGDRLDEESGGVGGGESVEAAGLVHDVTLFSLM